MKEKSDLVFSPEIPPDLEHTPLIREEAIDWLETHFPRRLTFTTGQVLRMAGEANRRWLITRLRGRDIGNQSEFSLPDTADALTALFLRTRGVKFSDAVNAVIGEKDPSGGVEPKYGGIWNRLIKAALDGLERRFPSRLLTSAIFALLQDPREHPNCLFIVKRQARKAGPQASNQVNRVSHDYVYQIVLERPSVTCAVVAPSRRVMLLARDQPPARSEVTSRHFVSLRISTDLENYELLLGTLKPVTISPDNVSRELVGRILDVLFFNFENFIRSQSLARLDTQIAPGPISANDLQLWLITELLAEVYPGSLSEISESSPSSGMTKVLASSVAKPWEPLPWDPVKNLEMLSGYACRTGVPLVVEKVEPPWTRVMEGVESELRFLRSKLSKDKLPGEFSAAALPIIASSGNTIGSLYTLMPRPARSKLDTEVRVLTIFSRIIGETIERHKETVYSADVAANVVSSVVLKRDQFKLSLLDLLGRKAVELSGQKYPARDVRLPFILISAHCPEADQADPEVAGPLKKWLVKTLCHLEWRSFIKSHWANPQQNGAVDGFIGEVPEIGIMIALGSLVSKDELDQIRKAFPTTFNQTSPTNSPVKLVAWVLDVPAGRILEAVDQEKLTALAGEIEKWAFEVATLVDDLAQSVVLAHEKGEWNAALRITRQALQKEGSRHNSYLRRLAAECSLALADWPSALKYAQEAVALSGRELGSGIARSMCLEGDAYLCLCQPEQAWEVYSEAVTRFPSHPLPRYYRGQALLLMARLMRAYQDECWRSGGADSQRDRKIDALINTLIDGAMQDLTQAADLLERWGLIPESSQYRNFHLLPTLIGQGWGYLLARSPGPAASRLQSARQTFPKDDLFFREFLFAKCWEQGLHRQYADLLLEKGWSPGGPAKRKKL